MNFMTPFFAIHDIFSEIASDPLTWPNVELENAIRSKAAHNPALCVAGADEVGRGALAGPVVVGLVVFPSLENCPDLLQRLQGLRDSKTLSPAQRQRLDQAIRKTALEVAIGLASAEFIDAHGINTAIDTAFQDALMNMHTCFPVVLADHGLLGNELLDIGSIFDVPDGDSRCLSIAAASVVAKVWRDNFMTEADKQHPDYGFASHKGYGTKLHFDALRQHGASDIHRKSWSFMNMLDNTEREV